MAPFVAGSGKSVLWFVMLFSLGMQKLMSSISSAIIQHVIALRDAGISLRRLFLF
jgi:excinuclease UvrABC ATPase subunit